MSAGFPTTRHASGRPPWQPDPGTWLPTDPSDLPGPVPDVSDDDDRGVRIWIPDAEPPAGAPGDHERLGFDVSLDGDIDDDRGKNRDLPE